MSVTQLLRVWSLRAALDKTLVALVRGAVVMETQASFIEVSTTAVILFPSTVTEKSFALGGCTDKDWKSSSCAQQCAQGMLSLFLFGRPPRDFIPRSS